MAVGEQPRVGISSCLLGENVRYDGGHKHNQYLTGTLARHLEFVPFCPEVAAGLGTPRPPIRLVRRAEEVRAVGVRDPDRDVTAAIAGTFTPIAGRVEDLSGYILKKDSPSCGMQRVRIHGEKGAVERKGVGIFAERLMQAFPALPVEEEGRLMDPGLRENFVERVFTLHRWQRRAAGGWTAAALVDFHTRHKFFVQAHDETTYRELGRLVADVGKGDVERHARAYLERLMQGLCRLATPAKNANVLMHILGFFKKKLDARDKAEMLDLIDAHRRGLVPVIVPITLLNHHLRRFPDAYVANQVYLDPHPRELMLRNTI